MVSEYKRVAKERKEIIEANPEFKSLDAEGQRRLLSGQEFHVGGLRALVRQTGFGVEQYEHISAYLSAFVHSAPVSFYRHLEHKIDFKNISGAQFALCTTVLLHVGAMIELVNERLTTVFSDALADISGPGTT